MRFPADLAVPTEVRAQDVGPRVERVWRLTRSIGTGGLRLARALPFAPGRPVRVELTLPGDDLPIAVAGVVELDRERPSVDADPPAAVVSFQRLEPETLARLARYVEERTAP